MAALLQALPTVTPFTGPSSRPACSAARRARPHFWTRWNVSWTWKACPCMDRCIILLCQPRCSPLPQNRAGLRLKSWSKNCILPRSGRKKYYLAFVVCGLAAVRRWAAAFSPRSGLRPIRTRNNTGTLSISLLQPVWRMSPRWAARAVASGLPISRWTRPHVSHRSGWESVSVYFPGRNAGATKTTRRVGKRAARFIL